MRGARYKKTGTHKPGRVAPKTVAERVKGYKTEKSATKKPGFVKVHVIEVVGPKLSDDQLKLANAMMRGELSGDIIAEDENGRARALTAIEKRKLGLDASSMGWGSEVKPKPNASVNKRGHGAKRK